jgi:hypothetical protein
MRILVTGKGGKSGSWKIRGEQLGATIGATVFPLAEMSEVRSHDLTVVVKRISQDLHDKLRGRRWVLDFVDGWPQPIGNEWPRGQAVKWLRDRLRLLHPTGVVFATTRMLEDSGWQGPALVLPHHAWPKYARGPVEARVTAVGYEGATSYLGQLRTVMERECASRGWQFVVNGDLSACQIGVALRDVGGYPAGAWKANTKLANLQALGLPALVSPEQGYREFGSAGQVEIDRPDQIGGALDRMTDVAVRTVLGNQAHAATPRLETVAQTYKDWLCQVAST